MSKFMAERICCTCKVLLSIDMFSWKNKAKGTKSHACKGCHKIYREKHYIDNKQAYIERATKYNKINPRRKAILKFSYAKCKGYVTCECCAKKDIESFYLKCPEGYDVDHILNVWQQGKNCLRNLQYLKSIEHKSKSGKEGGHIRWGTPL